MIHDQPFNIADCTLEGPAWRVNSSCADNVWGKSLFYTVALSESLRPKSVKTEGDIFISPSYAIFSIHWLLSV